MKKELVCKECGHPREIGRCLCSKCYLSYRRDMNNKRHAEGKRTKYNVNCKACGENYLSFRNIDTFCPKCRELRKSLSGNGVTNKYIHYSQNEIYRHEHRKIAEEILLRRLTFNEVIHHLDGNPKNNSLNNLILLSRHMHVKLHNYLGDQRVILEKSGNENLGNCWNTLIAPMTTAWLEMTNAKVIKLWEIGQSAAEPLSEKSYEEGSETYAPSILTSNVEDEDIVQTTTL